jgi:chemotaxis protein CheY-P-specific phosphatase CheC
MAEEVMLTELGNIVMNSLINGLLNALRRQSIPTIPGFAEGDLQALTADLGRTINVKQAFHIITASLSLQWDAATAKVEAIALVPEELAMELELLQPPAEQ